MSYNLAFNDRMLDSQRFVKGYNSLKSVGCMIFETEVIVNYSFCIKDKKWAILKKYFNFHY